MRSYREDGQDLGPDSFLDRPHLQGAVRIPCSYRHGFELSSNSVRESVLKAAEGKSFQDQNRAELVVDRAKTASQLQRNGFLRKAMDELKKTNSSQTVNIVWQKEDRKDKSRDVTVDGIPAFRQDAKDLKGIFLVSFSGTV